MATTFVCMYVCMYVCIYSPARKQIKQQNIMPEGQLGRKALTAALNKNVKYMQLTTI